MTPSVVQVVSVEDRLFSKTLLPVPHRGLAVTLFSTPHDHAQCTYELNSGEEHSMERVNRSEAGSTLVRRPLYTRFLEKATDGVCRGSCTHPQSRSKTCHPQTIPPGPGCICEQAVGRHNRVDRIAVLINRSVTRNALSPAGFQIRCWTVLSSPSLLSRALTELS